MKSSKGKRLSKIIQLVVLWFIVAAMNPTIVRGQTPISQRSGSLTATAVYEVPDARVLKLEKFLAIHNSPLTEYAEDFVKSADEYELGDNWTLVAAIAGIESTFGKHIPTGSYNAWGWGIPTGTQSGLGFNDWTEGIDTVTKGLSENYIANGADTPEKMGPIYAPPSHTWAGNVRFFMSQIESTTPYPELTI
jgi:hypothetical protein